LFKLAADGFYRVPEWAAFEWLEHGFGTREAVHSGDNLATVKQVHSADVLIVERPGLQGTGDALISNTPGLVVGVKTADCLPILLVDPVNRAVAAVHAGWRGTAQRIVERAIVTMGRHFSSVSDNIEAAIGPGIGRCCFEVGAEVAREFGPYESDQKTCLDLARINRDQLASRGVKRVYESGLCTFCSAREFYSFRREREQAGRMISMAGQTV
jgi:YfiH family protein